MKANRSVTVAAAGVETGIAGKKVSFMTRHPLPEKSFRGGFGAGLFGNLMCSRCRASICPPTLGAPSEIPLGPRCSGPALPKGFAGQGVGGGSGCPWKGGGVIGWIGETKKAGPTTPPRVSCLAPRATSWTFSAIPPDLPSRSPEGAWCPARGRERHPLFQTNR